VGVTVRNTSNRTFQLAIWFDATTYINKKPASPFVLMMQVERLFAYQETSTKHVHKAVATALQVVPDDTTLEGHRLG
jgi:hypothetical protein